MWKDEAELKIRFIISIASSYNSFTCSIYSFTFSCSIIIFPVKRFPNKLRPNVPNNILRNPPLCFFTSFWTVSVTSSNNKPKSSRDFTILIMSCHYLILLVLHSLILIFFYVFLHLLLMRLQLILMELKHF